MLKHKYQLGADTVTIRVVQTESDLDGFLEFVRSNPVLGLDSETTGIEIYSRDFRCRVVQLGNATDSWVIPVERGGRYEEEVRAALLDGERFVLHNAAYDLQVFDRCLGIPMEQMWPKVTDTVTLAKLVDPRPAEKGGFGHSLEEVTARFIDPELASEVKGSMTALAKSLKTTKAKVWEIVSFDNEDYQRYAGMDPVLAYRAYQKLEPLVPQSARRLIPYEHKLSEICSYIERNGFLLDVEYSQGLADQMLRDEEVWSAIAFTEYGVESVNSNREVVAALQEQGVKFKTRTESGEFKLDKTILEPLIEQGNELAEIVQETKKLGKWRKTWVQKFLDTRDDNDRCHASINPLQARTSRMSITGIPAQTLPSGDWVIRRCFVAEPGHVIASVDYKAQELRVLAALSEDETMIRAFQNDEDLHQITADASGVERSVGKMANFLTVYGGGPSTLAQNAGISFPTAKKVLDGFAATYPGVARLSQRLQREAKTYGYITTPTGRRLPVDPDRAYSALNYLIQSTSRDVTGAALIRLHEAGFTPYLRLPIHDEIVASLPAEQAVWGSEEIARLMMQQMGPVEIGTDPDVYGFSWGHGYMDEETKESQRDWQQAARGNWRELCIDAAGQLTDRE